jgi:hypothetical protein
MMPSWLNDPADVQAVAAIASFLVTVILAGLTYAYVKDSKRMADQIVQQGDPIVVGRIEPYGGLYAQYVLTNVGLGPARNVELKLRVDHEAAWRDTILLPGKSQYFFLPVDGGVQDTSFNELRNNKKILASAYSFEDRNGRKFPITEATVDFQQLSADWDHAHWQLRKSDALQAADEVKDAINKLAKQTAKISELLQMHLPRVTTPTGLAISATTLRNLQAINSGGDIVQKITPRAGDLGVFIEVLGVDRPMADRLYNYFRLHSQTPLKDLEGMTPELAAKIVKLFRAPAE